MASDLTVTERILLAAEALTEKQPTFSAEDLIVKAWELYPEHFGLQGYAEKYPDSNRILTKIMGTAGLRGKGWLEKVGEKRYRISEVGRVAAGKLRKGNGNGAVAAKVEPMRAGALDRKLVIVLERMLSSSAVEKFQEQQPLTFSDVCAFWNISPRSTANQLTARTTEADLAIEQAIGTAKAAGAAEIVLPGDAEPVSVDDLHLLQELVAEINAKFANELAVIKRRIDERRY